LQAIAKLPLIEGRAAAHCEQQVGPVARSHEEARSRAEILLTMSSKSAHFGGRRCDVALRPQSKSRLPISEDVDEGDHDAFVSRDLHGGASVAVALEGVQASPVVNQVGRLEDRTSSESPASSRINPG